MSPLACQVAKSDAGAMLLLVPCSERVPPLIFRLVTRCRRHRSAALLSAGTAVSATRTCSVTSIGTTGTSMTSRVRCTHPPTRCVPQFGQTFTACSTRWVSAIRRRVLPRKDALAVFGPRSLVAVGLRAVYCQAFRAIRRCNWAMVAFCSAIIASRVSRLAVVRSSSVSTFLVYHDCPNTAHILAAPLDQIYLIKPEQLLKQGRN